MFILTNILQITFIPKDYYLFLSFKFNYRLLNMELNRLKKVLSEQGRTNKWLAKQIGKSQVSVSRWCSNATQPSLETLWEIATALDVDVRELLVSNKEN